MSKLQELLDRQAKLSNELYEVENEIRRLRGTTPPGCWGEDDCSTQALSVCAWRIDCGSEESVISLRRGHK